MRNAAEDREATRLLADYDRIVARLRVLGIDVVKLRALDAKPPRPLAFQNPGFPKAR